MTRGAHDQVMLRPTHEADLDFVLRLESDPENSPFIGSWTREEHLAAITVIDREHWIIEVGPHRRTVGYLIALDLRASGRGVHVKRVVVSEKSRGIGRGAMREFARHAFATYDPPFVWLDALGDNLRGQTAYRAAGFRERSFPESEMAEWARAVDGFEDGSVLMFLEASPP